MQRSFLILLSTLLMLFAVGVVGETDEEVKYEMLPLQPPSDNPLERAIGLMRCYHLYFVSDVFIQQLCGLGDWMKENEGDVLEFKNSEQFKTCGGPNKASEDYQNKLRSDYASKFWQEAHRIALEEGVEKETLYLNGDEQVDTYLAMIQDSVLNAKITKQEIKKIPLLLSNDLSTCMDYRDYIDSIYKQ